MRRTAALVSLLLVVAGACSAAGDDEPATGGGRPSPSPAVALTASGGCGDTWFWMASADGRVALTVAVEATRRSTRHPVVVDVDLSDPAVDARLLRGDGDLTRNFCVDVLDPDSEPDEVVPVGAGRGTVTVDPVPTDVPACGHTTGGIELRDVVAEDGTDLGAVAGRSTAIGCFAG